MQVIVYYVWYMGSWPGQNTFTQGLDLKGGVSITYQVAESDKSNLTADTLEKTRAKLEKRIAAFSTRSNSI